MTRRTFDVVDVTEILTHWHAGRSQLQLADSLGVDPKTVRKYTAPAIAAGMAPGGPPGSPQRWAELVREWFPQLVDAKLRGGELAGDRPVSRRDQLAARCGDGRHDPPAAAGRAGADGESGKSAPVRAGESGGGGLPGGGDRAAG
jgi:hypothetical protein